MEPLLPPTGRFRVPCRAKLGPQEQALVESCINLCWYHAKRFAAKACSERQGKADLYMDLWHDSVSAAFEGLVEAARRFDPDRGYQFTTYATPWIIRYLQRNRAHQAAIDPSFVDHNRGTYRGPPVHRLNWLFTDGEMTDLAEPEKPESDSPSDRDRLWAVIAKYTSTLEYAVLWGRFREELTLQDLGDRLGCTKEWVRLVQDRALHRLKSKKELRLFGAGL